jgi:hypothetical protein
MHAQPIGYCRNSFFHCPTYRHIGYIASVSLIHGVQHGGGMMGRLFWPSANTATVGARGVCCGQWSLLHQAQISANQFRDGAGRVALCSVPKSLNGGSKRGRWRVVGAFFPWTSDWFGATKGGDGTIAPKASSPAIQHEGPDARPSACAPTVPLFFAAAAVGA